MFGFTNLLLLLPFLLLVAITVFLIIVISHISRHASGNTTLYRSQRDRAIAGVCGGIAIHYGLSSTIVRLVFLLLGIGVLPYIILAIVIPESPSRLL